MKKIGFTLAEILISLAIIGIVAAICIPTLGTSARKQANLTTMKVTVSDFENAFNNMMISEAKEEITSVNDWNTTEKLSNFIKINGNKTKNGTEFTIKNTTLILDINGSNSKPNKDGVDIFELNIDEYGLIDTSKYTSEE